METLKEEKEVKTNIQPNQIKEGILSAKRTETVCRQRPNYDILV